MKTPLKDIFFIGLLFVTTLLTINAQEFQRVENIVGFADLHSNNGVAVADYDADNDLDIFVVANAVESDSSVGSKSKLFRNNNNGTFTDVTEVSGLTSLLTADEPTTNTLAQSGHKFGVFWGDINNDGYPDILFTHTFKVQLFLNLGDGTFRDITANSGILERNDCINTGAVWFDYDNDSYLDLYISDWNRCGSNKFYKNNGNNTFTDVTEQSGLIEPISRYSYTPFPFDINNDGWMDLIVTNDLDRANYAYINQNGMSFSEQASSYSLDSGIDDMAIAINDFDNDNDFDFFITGIDENALLVNDGSNNFSDQASVLNLNDLGWAWGARFADFDLDGDEDLYLLNGYEFEARGEEQNKYFKNLNSEGQNAFIDASANVGLGDTTISVEAIDFDYDNDGDLDLFVTNGESFSFFYENKLLNFDKESDLKWLKVSLIGTASNRNAIGTKLVLVTSQGNFIRYHSGVGFLSQSLQATHFGLPSNAEINQIEVSWPSGLVEVYQNLQTNTTVKITEGQGLELLNSQPSEKIYGCLDPNSCNYNPLATINDGSCQYLSSSTINGPDTSSFYKTEKYFYDLHPNAKALWTVSGGEIVEGQYSNEITVRWHIEPQGEITVKTFDDVCYSQPVLKIVTLNADEIPQDKSIARIWNEVLLEAIRGDFARPTVHARNLFHTSIAMYDAWAIYSENDSPYLIGNSVMGFTSELQDFKPDESIQDSRKKAISYAAYRLIYHRFINSPGWEETSQRIDLVMNQLGFDTSFVDTNYKLGNAAALGNYIAQTIIDYGYLDGSREISDYDNAYYKPENTELNPSTPNDFTNVNPNKWQPLNINAFVDQSGNLISGEVIDFLSPEWGNVKGFALSKDNLTTYTKEGNEFNVYYDPNPPPYLEANSVADSKAYKWGFSMVSVWQSHLDPTDNVLWDISPKTIGDVDFENLPIDYAEYSGFYNFFDGGDIGNGHSVNPITETEYEEQVVPRGDYTRVLAEFWADGPDSETPPGHWFTILNYINDNPLLEKRLQGLGEVLGALEWDVKSYFTLGGAMHDAAISAWSVKGWYDYIRPISAIRFMASRGQSSNASAPNYSPEGIDLIPGYIEQVKENDILAGINGEHINKIKVYTWRGHDYIGNTDTDNAGVGWILAENWWPYQRPNFVTPPFAGYVSGHSTYSRAAAEVLTAFTGSEFFPGGLGEFIAKKDEFLVFEQGPSIDIKLQWATYRDASDQCSLSRIWGGIHPPADDIPGRKIGEKVGISAFNYAMTYFSKDNINLTKEDVKLFPNPVNNNVLSITNTTLNDEILVFDLLGRRIKLREKSYNSYNNSVILIFPDNLLSGLYLIKVNNVSKTFVIKK